MDLFEAIKKRHCCRGAFLDEAPTRADLKKIVQAGLDAPSGCNAQTTEFVIIDDLEIVSKINHMHENSPAMQQAKAFVACVLNRTPQPVYQGMEFEVEDCAAAVENILLAITASGFASVWIDGWLRPEGRADKIGRLINLPQRKYIRILLPIGKPAKQPTGPEKKTFEQRVRINKY